MRIGLGHSLALLVMRADACSGIARVATLALVARVQRERAAIGIPPAVEIPHLDDQGVQS